MFTSYTDRPIIIIMLLIATLAGALSFYRPSEPRFLESDLAVYFTAVRYMQQPNGWANDTLYKSGYLAKSRYWTSTAYMGMLHGFLSITNDNAQETQTLIYILLLMLYIPAMYLLLVKWLHNRWIALLLAWVSSITTGYLITGASYGISPYPFAHTVYTAILPYLLLIIGQVWRKAPHYRVWPIFGLGLLVGSTLIWANTIAGLGILQWLVCLGIYLILSRQLPAWALLVFLLGVLPIILLRSVGSSGLVDSNLTWEDAKTVIALGQEGTMIYPWHRPWDQLHPGLTWQQHEDYTQRLALAYSSATILLGTLTLFWRGDRRLCGIGLVVVQLLAVMFILNVGWLALLIGLYALPRIWQRTLNQLDLLLLISLGLFLWIGPLEQMVLYALWDYGKIIQLTGLIFEAGRFIQYIYLPFYGLLGLSIASITRQAPNRWLQSLWVAAIVYCIYRNLFGYSPLIMPFDSNHGLLLGAILISILINGRIPDLPFSKGLAILGFVGITWLIISPMKHLDPPSHTAPSDINLYGTYTPQYAQMTAWVRQNAPSDAVFHLTTFNRSFRWDAQRSLLVGNEEWSMGIYAGYSPRRLRDIEITLRQANQDSNQLLQLVQTYKIDYLIGMRLVQAVSLPIVYENDLYVIYQVSDGG